MESVRITPLQPSCLPLPCSRCGSAQRPWDRIAGKVYCPECQEALILGLTAPVIEPAERNPCAACNRSGTVQYLTFPLKSSIPVEIDLCPEHIRCLLGRRLRPYAFHQLRRRLLALGLRVGRIFLLHDAFYDNLGRALQPAKEAE
jgi:hypothetical protein